MKSEEKGMSLIVKTITRLTVGLILIYGIFTVLKSHSSPGGGFAGGVIIALSLIHLVLAFGKDEVKEKLNEAVSLILIALGMIIVLILSAVNFLGYQFPAYHSEFKVVSFGVSSIVDIAVALMVSAGLYLMFLLLVNLANKKGKI